MIFGVTEAARRERREDPARHLPRGGDEAGRLEAERAEHRAAFVDAALALVAIEIRELGFPGGRDALREERPAVGLVEEAVQDDLVARRAQLAQAVDEA